MSIPPGISETEPSNNVVINESLARRDFALRDPVRQRIHLNTPESPFSTIVGVVADLKYAKLDEQPEPEVYVPYAGDAPGGFTAVVRTSVEPTALAATMRTSLSDIDRALPIFDVQTLEQTLADSIAPRRFNLLLLALFAASAVGLALIGIYGVTTYAVAQRTHEIGVRMALGADQRDIVAMVMRQGSATAVVGVAVGIVVATWLTRVMASLLYDVRPIDLPTFTTAAVGLALAALAAALIPAFRASRIDPAKTLR